MGKFGQAYKKRAIAWVLSQTKAELILTTDADCIPPATWLRTMVEKYQATGADCLAAPVVFSPSNSWVERFQTLDFMGMMLLTGAGLQGRFQLLCNGANFAYTRAIYEQVKGFEGLTDYASGDDLLLLKKILNQVPTAKFVFVKDLQAAVPTLAQPTWSSFLRQRLRWASKSGHRPLDDWGGTWRLLWVAAFASGLCLAPLLAYWWTALDLSLYILAWLLKLAADAYLLWPATAFFQRKDLRKIFFLSVFLHAFYIFSVALLSNVQKSYLWKGRRLR
jgi:cellulose synthase/poly-beta-1,6-N-acetylglucosamine synthase-like glycosyltransferase